MKKLIATTALALIMGGPAAAQATQETTQPQTGQAQPQTEQQAQTGQTQPQTEQQAQTGQQQDGQPPQAGQTESGQAQTAQGEQPDAGQTQTETVQTGAGQTGQDQQMAGGAFYQPQQDDQLLSAQGDQGQQAQQGEIQLSDLMDATVYAPQTQQGGQQQGGQQEQQATGGQQPEGQQQEQQATGGQQQDGQQQEQQAAGGQQEGGQQQPQTAGAGSGAGGGALEVTEIAEDELQQMQEIGTVTDVIVSQQGDVQALVVEVGGFLGEGAREVALAADQLTFGQVGGEQGELAIVAQLAADELQTAPEFQRADVGGQQDQQQAAGGEQQPAGAQPEQQQAAGGQQQPAGEQQAATADTGQAETDGAEVVVIQEGEQAAQDEVEIGAAEGTETEEVEIEAAEGEQLQPAEETETAAEQPAENVEIVEGEDVAANEADTTWRGDREAFVAPTIEREGFTPTEASEISVETLMGTDVYDTNDENIGSISDVVMDESGAAQFAVLNVGGFLGLGARSVAIGFDEMQILRGEGDELRAYVDATQEMIESMPEYEAAEN